jgi:MFS transporter, DHA1 family, solute carrier family 18 (vesicular amine transporter), member 1/2
MTDQVDIGRFRVLGVVTFALFMDYLIYGLIVPLAPYSPAGAMSEDRLALLYSTYALGVLAATPLFGFLGERIGYRRSMIFGVALSGIAIVLFWLAPNLPLLLLARLFQGASAAATWTVGLALIAEHYVQNRIKMMGYALVGSTAGSIVGPVIGGGLQQVGGYSLPLAVTAGMVAADFVLRVFLLPVERLHASSSPDLRALLIDRSVLAPALATALAAFGWGIVEPLLPADLERAGVASTEIGLIFTIAPIAYGLSAPLVAWASERVAIRWVIAFGVVGMACSLAAISQLSGIVAIGCGLCMLSAAFAFKLNPSSAELGNAVDRRGLACYAAVYAVYNIAYSVGMMATNVLAGAAARWASVPQILLGAGVALLVCIPLLLVRGPRAEVANP